MRNQERPKPGDFKEIARGSGPAALLMFLHIAVIGYLGFVVYYFLMHGISVFWNLVPFSAGILYYFPAAFAVFTLMPTDKLTRVVGLCALVAGLLTIVIYAISLIKLGLSEDTAMIKPPIETLCAIAAGAAGGLLMRVIFRMGIGKNREIV